MGPRHSKRSLDMAGTPTKSEIEGVGNAGKLEKIVDGIVEKVATNGHVEGELQNGAEPLHNGLEQVQNGDASALACDDPVEKLKIDDKEREEAINGVNGEAEEKVNGEVDEKKDKKKDKKEKVVKKKFSFRSFSFSKKDKSKPKDEKSADAQAKAGIEESPEAVVENTEPTVEEAKEQTPEQKPAAAENILIESKDTSNIVPPPVVELVNAAVSEVVVETGAASPAGKVSDELPPPLPASPPPSELKEDVAEEKKDEAEELPAKDDKLSFKPVNLTAISNETEEAANEVLTATEQIEEKATDLLKVVEEKAKECQRNESDGKETAAEESKTDDEVTPSDVTEVKQQEEEETVAATVDDEAAPKTEESVVSNIVTLSQTGEETSDKQEEFGAGESLAEMDVGPEATPNTNQVAVME